MNDFTYTQTTRKLIGLKKIKQTLFKSISLWNITIFGNHFWNQTIYGISTVLFTIHGRQLPFHFC
jgi:hypothetical protein